MNTTSAQSSPSQPTGLAYASLRHMMTSVLTTLAPDPRGTGEDHEVHREAAVAILGALHPTDAVQHMCAARTAAAHFTAMECFRRAGLPDQPDQAFTCLLRLADGMERMSTRSLDRLKRCQSEAADRRRPAMPGLAATIARAGRSHPMSSENPAPHPTPQPAARAATAKPSATPPSATLPQAAPAGLTPAEHPAQAVSGSRSGPAFRPGPVSDHGPEAPAPRRENGRNNAMPSEPHPGEPHPGEPHPGEPHPGEPHPGEPHPGEPHPGPTLPFDRQAWLAAVRAMSPREQYALASRIQALRGEPPLS
jgi:hypothetical protein